MAQGARGAEFSVLRLVAEAGLRGMTVRDVAGSFSGTARGAVPASAQQSVNLVMGRLIAKGWLAGTGIATFHATAEGRRALRA